MATIANLAVSVTARIGSFEKGLNKAIKMTKRFSRDLIHHISTITKYAAAIVSAGIVIGSYLVKQQFEAIDSIAKLSRTLGLSTEELSGYSFAASLAGVDSEHLGMKFAFMNKAIAENAMKMGHGNKAFKALGLSAKALAGLSTDKRIKLLADEYNKIGDAANRSAFLIDVFGKKGLDMGSLFEMGSKGLAEAQAEAKRLELSFTELDSSKVEMANDAITSLKAILTGAARVIAVNLAPFILAAAERLQEMSLQGGGMGEVVTNAFNWVLRAVGRLADYFELLKSIWYGFQAIVILGAGTIITIFAGIAKGIQEVINLIPGMNVSFGDNLVGMVAAFRGQGEEAFDKMITAYDKFDKRVHSSGAEITFEQIRKRAEEQARTLGGNNKLLQDAQDIASGKTAMARRIDLSSTVLGSFKDKGPTLKQGEQMVSYLKVIAGNTKREAAVVVS